MLTLLEPIFHRVEVSYDGSEWAFDSIRIDDAHKFLLNGMPLDSNGPPPQLQATYVAAQ